MEKPILLVDDNPDDVDLTLRALKKSNMLNEVIVASDGEKALELLLADKPLNPAVVLLDLNLPKIDGLGVLRRIRSDKRTKLLPVVILTSSNEESDLINGYELGANSYIRKPVDFNHFIEAVQTLGLYWLLLNEPPPVK
jgi:two-component system response regulator